MLGVPGDTEKHYLYPFGGNVCYACPAGIWKYGAVSEDRQQELCLSGHHEACPSYQRCTADEPSVMKPNTWFQRAAALWRMRAKEAEKSLPGIGLVYLESFETK